MTPTLDTQTLTLLALIPLVAWRVVARFRRMIGRQRLSRIRPWIQLAVFALLLALLCLAAYARHGNVAWLGVGLAGGGALSLYGLRKTEFEATPQGLFYTPHARLGLVLSSLFLLRVLWRIGELLLHGVPAQGHDDFTFSPYTLAPVGLFAGYSMGYAVGLIGWRFRLLRRKAKPLRSGSHPNSNLTDRKQEE